MARELKRQRRHHHRVNGDGDDGGADDEYESLSQPDKLSSWHSNHKGHKGKGKGHSKPSTRGNGHNEGGYQGQSAEKSKWDPSKVAKTTTPTEAHNILVYC